jgi:glutathione synthase/RimK-type ligase-like ATP-grasp enzyme
LDVLVLTKSDDNVCVDTVSKAIEKRGGHAIRFDTDRFPDGAGLSYRTDGIGDRATLAVGNARHDLGRLSAVWYRRTHPASRLPETMETQLRRASVRESAAAFYAMIHGLPAFHLDPIANVQRARNKLAQLRAAREAGLAIPRTLISNDPDEVRAFADACAGNVVTKMLTSFAVYEEGKEKVVFTTPLGEKDLEDLSGLRYCPMVFQERVEKESELRITIVGRRVFAASVDSQSLERASVDWRREGLALVEDWKEYDLPGEVRDRLFRVLDAFGLEFGAIDVIVTPSGDHVFVEVNPIGEFFWLERHPGFPISDAIASVLLEPSERRVS